MRRSPRNKHIIHANAPNGAAIMYTTRIESAKACFNATTPAPMIAGVTPGIVVRAAVFPPAKAVMNALSEVAGNPALSAALPISLGKLVSSFVFRAAENIAVKTVAATAREDVVTAVAVAIKRCGVESCTPDIIRMRGAPNPKPERAANASWLKSSPGWIVHHPMIPPVKNR